MTPSEFVKAIQKVIGEGTPTSTIEAIKSPPGRRPDSELLELSSWYLSLPVEHQSQINKLIRWTCDLAAFQFLCVIDGVVAIEDIGDKGHLELTYIKDDQRLILNEPESDFLHDLYKGDRK